MPAGCTTCWTGERRIAQIGAYPVPHVVHPVGIPDDPLRHFVHCYLLHSEQAGRGGLSSQSTNYMLALN